MNRTTPALAALALGSVLTLSGCFANPLDQLTEGLVEGGVEQIIEDQTGVDVDVNGSGASLPDSWPADVPTVDGSILFSAAADGTFTAGITVASTAAAEDAFTRLLDAGYTQTGEFDLGDGASTRTFENGAWTVGIIIVPDGTGAAQVQYSVTPLTP